MEVLRRLLILNIALCPLAGYAATEVPVRWDGFVDAQYAFDFNAPASGDRTYSTQPARHNEFNINLAYLAASLEKDNVRGRLAVQAGTSVQSNYAAEPSVGAVSGGLLSRHIQEARAGYRLGPSTWIDGGIFLAHVGAETWVSKDNITLTRSLVADYSPYYLSGIKLSHRFSERLSGQLLVTNGWQNISENNKDKNIGTGLEYSGGSYSLAYNTMLGNEGKFRHFHDFVLKSKGFEFWELVAQFDVGFQDKSSWYGSTLMARYSLDPEQKISARLEHYTDPDQVVLVTNLKSAMNAVGTSLGFDQKLAENLNWRSEVRYLKATKEVMPKGSGELKNDNCTLTTSLAMSF